MTVLAAVDWTGVLEVGVPTWIAATGGAIAAILTAKNMRSLKTANGGTIAQAVEATHSLVTENQQTLDTISENNPAKP